MKKSSQLVKRQHEGTESMGVSTQVSGSEISVRDRVRKVPVDTLQSVVNPGRVRVETGVTKNMGNYESLRVSVAVDWPCAPTEESLQKTYAYISERAAELLREELQWAVDGDYLNN